MERTTGRGLWRHVTVSVVGAAAAIALSGCGGGLDGSSTCSDYLGASYDEQHQVVSELAGKYHQPDYATPLGFPNVAYVCAQNPDLTLEDYFSQLQ